MAFWVTSGHAWVGDIQVYGDRQKPELAKQVERATTQAKRLNPALRLACWQRVEWRPVLDTLDPTTQGTILRKLDHLSPASRQGISEGDRLISIGATKLTASGRDGLRAAMDARSTGVEKLVASGERFKEVVETVGGGRVELDSPVRWGCGTTIAVTDNPDRAATRSFSTLLIGATRLARLDDDELAAFMLWNENFVSFRHESNAGAWAVASALFATRTIQYQYNAATFAKIDWVTLEGLHRIGVDPNAYSRMLKKVEAFDEAAGFNLLGSRSFIDTNEGGSPRWSEEKQTRLDTWIAALGTPEQDKIATGLQFSNGFLANFVHESKTAPLTDYMSIAEALKPFIGAQAAAAHASRYLGNFGSPISRVRSGDASLMIYVHLPSKQLVLDNRKPSSVSAQERCSIKGTCALLAVGPAVIARPDPKWQAELDETPGASYEVIHPVK